MEKYQIAAFETYGREPVLRRMGDGSLLCTFLTGGAQEPANDNFVAVSRSTDDGKTWTTPEPLFRHNKRGTWCTEVFTGWEYPTAFVYTYNAACYYRELLTFWSESRDNGKTWSEPTTVPGHVNGCSLRQGITLSNGDTLFPLYWQEAFGMFDYPSDWSVEKPWRFSCGVGIRPAGSASMLRCGYISNPSLQLWEPNVVEMEDGHLLMYLRNCSGVLRYAESFDYGRTWSEDRPTGIPHSDAKVSAWKLGGKVFMLNNAVDRGRTHLELSCSENGLDFTHIRYIEDKEARFFYPHALVDDAAQTLYIAYENGKEHFLMKLPYDEIGV